jgi:hypothetical protein
MPWTGSKPVVRIDLEGGKSAPSVPPSQRHKDALLWLHTVVRTNGIME